MDVYTQTLTSTHILVVEISADFGELVIAGALLFFLTLMVGDFLYRLVYRT